MRFRDLIFKKYYLPFPSLLRNIPVEKRKAGYVLLLIFLFFIALQILLLFAATFFFFSDFKINSFDILMIAAFLPAVLYFLISLLRKQPKARAIFNAAQYFVFFSLLPYVVPKCFGGWGNPIGGKIWSFLFYFGIILPEVVAFIAFVILKRNRIIGWIILGLALLVAIEILPIRRTLFVRFSIGMFEDVQEYGDGNLEIEFSRSIEIIEKLAEKSKEAPISNLWKVTIFVPYSDETANPNRIFTSSIGKYEKHSFLIDTIIDSDNDGLADFREAELLCDAYDADTDGDGIADGKDSDPLNEYRSSRYGEVKSAILSELGNDRPFFLVYNGFNRGLGEFDNFDKHVILLNHGQQHKWYIMFGMQYAFRSHYGVSDYDDPYNFDIDIANYGFDGYKFDILKRIALADFSPGHGGGIILLIKWGGKWHVIREIWLYI